MELDAPANAQPDAPGQQPVNPCSAAAAPSTAAVAPAGDDAVPKKQSKRKVAMHLAYLGAGFHGMQRNPGCATIESELESALVKAGAVSEHNAGSFQKIHWNRAARTDKGVSALCQVVSAKLMIEPKEGFAARVNTHLPDQIRVFGVQRTTEGFDARKFCDKRKYEYILPAWAFDPQAAAQGRTEQQDTTAAAAAVAGVKRPKKAAAGSSSARLADEAAALQAIAAAVLAAPEEPTSVQAAAAAAGGTAEDSDTAAAGTTVSGIAAGVSGVASCCVGGSSVSDGGGGGGGVVRPRDCVEDEVASSSRVGQDVLHRLREDIAVSRQRYVFGPSQLQRLNSLLEQYEGTQNFHNFTVRVPAGDPAARRYILSFTADVIDIGGAPWVRLVVVGQSFMLHQIRKMVGLVLAIMRNVAPEECLQLALDPDRDVITPMAPELGLFLDETYFDAYNARFAELHGPVTFEPHRPAATDFKHRLLYNHIAALDGKELVNALWLRGCSDTSFRFSRWSQQPKVREISKMTHHQQQQMHHKQHQGLQEKLGANGHENKRKQQDAAAAGGGSGVQQQPKLQRLERPGKLEGASAAMVIGMQETYGMRPHSDTQQAAEFRRELKLMREDYAQAQHKQHQQQQQQEAAEEDLDALYA